MKIKVSKVFADFINKTAKEMNFKVSAKVVEFSENMYRLHVSYDIFRAEDFGDYNYNTGKYKAIQLIYPEDYYACANYLTTYQLTQEFRRYNVSTISELKDMIKNICEI